MEMCEVTDPGPSGSLCHRPRKTLFPIVQGIRLVASITGLRSRPCPVLQVQYYISSVMWLPLLAHFTSWSTFVLLTLLLERRLITANQEPRSPSYLVTVEN